MFAPESPAAHTRHLGIDATGVPMRKRDVEGRAGTREVKLVVIWTAEDWDQDGLPVCDGGSITYSAAIDCAASHDTDAEPPAFTRRMRREAPRRGFPDAPRRVILGDGTKWIWRAATEVFPGAIQIVDFFHAAEKMWEVARALFPQDRDSRVAWAAARCTELKAGNLDGLLATLRALADHCEAAAQCLQYVETNRERMRYADFRAQGLQIGSGVVEARCRTIVGARLKQSGMHWTQNGADGILALRTCSLSGPYEYFWAWRTEPPLSAAA